MPSEQGATIREAVGMFETADAMQDAIDELMSSGFDRAELSLLASERTVEEKLGHQYRKVAELEDDPMTPRTCYVSKESIGDAEGGLIGGLLYMGAVAAAGVIVASGGTVAAAVAGAMAAGGAGGILGSVLARLVGHHHTELIHEHLKHGGLLLWVRTLDAEQERKAVAILQKHSGHDVHVHALPALPALP